MNAELLNIQAVCEVTSRQVVTQYLVTTGRSFTRVGASLSSTELTESTVAMPQQNHPICGEQSMTKGTPSKYFVNVTGMCVFCFKVYIL